MPIGEPVVRPSKTPESIRTASGSRRWLVNCEVPARRRSTSGCRSASDSSMPGGQPSTMQPSAAPWLSPKVVTANNRPSVLPDNRSTPLKAQILAPEHEDTAAAAFETQPDKGGLWKRAAQCPLRIADLDDQDSAGF